MSYDKYYEEFYRDGKLNNKFITYLSAIDMSNKLLNRDVLKNTPIKDLCSNYAKKASIFYNDINSSLGFVEDDIQVIYNYAINHIDSILEKPNQSIIKEQKLVAKEKIKQIEPKTFNWLANKPGISIKEKLAYVNKISSPVKRYTNNIKENQVTLAFFKDLYKILIFKISLIENNRDLFGQSNNEILQLKNKLNKLKYKFRNEFDEVVEKDYTTPNNTLLGNKDYSVIWKSYLDLKQNTLSYADYFKTYIKSFKLMLISLLMNNYDYVEQNLDLDDLYQSILYSVNNDVLREITFENGVEFIIITKDFSLKEKVKLLNTKTYIFKFEELEETSNSGVLFNLSINNEIIGIFNADNLGFKNAYLKICEYILLNVNLISNDDAKEFVDFISLNSCDNRIYPSNKILNATFDNTLYRNKDIYFANNENISLNNFNNSNYLSYLRLLHRNFETNENEYVIYDISDNYDEFSSTNLRRNISSVFNKSYPVWRSILAGESLEDKTNIEYIIDMCGKDKSIVISKLERKNNRFVHCGVIDTPIYLQNFNEINFYKSYIKKYEEKYSISFPNEIEDCFINSGKLNLLLEQKLDNIILLNGMVNNHNYYIVKFDSELFNDVCLDFIKTVKAIFKYYDEDKCKVIVPNFLRNLALKSSLFICNNELTKGAKVISQRVKNNEITWYEKLPKLSLEVIKNGIYDNLILVDNKECENIIGKSITFEVLETLTLSKGQNNYILPLNKSFLGDNNESFVAIAEDKSFPLEEDINVKLQLTYSFGSENSYLLKLIPIDNAPFKSIDIIWKKDNRDVCLIYPKILGKCVTSNYEKDLMSFKSNCEYVNKACDLLRKKSFKGNNKFIYEDIRRNSYLHQNMVYGGFDITVLNQIMIDSNYYDNLKFLHSLMIYNYEKEIEPKYKDIAQWNLEDIECAMIECFREEKFFDKKYLRFPETCYGWYFSYMYDDSSVICDAYNALIEMSETDNFLSSKKLRMHFQSLTTAATNNYLMPYLISKTNSSYIIYLLKVIVKIMKEMAEYDYLKPSDDRNNNPKENAFLMRFCIEILISYLFLRELPQFEDLRPNGKIANEIIHYLKIFNKKFYFVTNWYGKTPTMKSKYNMSSSEQPFELNNTLPEIYCLILYLSGDEGANYIKIGGE